MTGLTKKRIGTPYFPTLDDAYSYYSVQHIFKRQVDSKIQNQEIFIGEPPLKKGDRLILVKEVRGSRFHIESLSSGSILEA